MSPLATTSLQILVIATLAGCGQMGPLYMPEEAPAQTTGTATTPTTPDPAGDD